MATPTLTLTTTKISNTSELQLYQGTTKAPQCHVLSMDTTESGSGSVQEGGSGRCETITKPIVVETELGSSVRLTYWLPFYCSVTRRCQLMDIVIKRCLRVQLIW